MDNNTAILNFINEACKQDDTNIDISIAELTSAIHTLEREKEKRETKKRQILIDDFENAFRALRNAKVRIKYDIDPSMLENDYEWVAYELDDIDCFEFN